MNKPLLKTLAIIAILLGSIACEKTKKEDDAPKNDLAILENNLTPGDVFVFKPNFKLEGDSWTIMVNNTPTVLFRVSDSTVGMVTPYVASGALKVDFSAVNGPVKTVNIGAYTPVADPAAVIATFNTDFNAALTDVQSTMPEHAAMFAQLSNTYNRLLAGLTDAEKKELAFYLQKIHFDMPEGVVDEKGNVLGREAGFTLIKVPSVINNDHEYYSGKLASVSLGVTAAAGLLIAVPALMAPDPTTVSQLASLAAIAGSSYIACKAIRFWNVTSVYKGEAKEVQTGSFTSSYNRMGARVMADGDSVLLNNKPVAVTAEVVYANMTTADRNTPTLSGRVITTLEALVKTYNNVTGKLNKVSSWFGGSPVVTPLTFNLSQTAGTVVRKAPGNLLSIENVSLPAVTFSVKATDTSFIITPASELKEKKDISFDLVYTHKEMELKARKTINTKFDGREFLVNGKWKIRRIVAVSNPADTIPIRANGEIFYDFSTEGNFRVTQRSYEGYSSSGGGIVYDWHSYSLYFMYHYNDVGWGSDFGEKWALSEDKKNLVLTVRNTAGSGSVVCTEKIGTLSENELIFTGPRSRGNDYPYTFYLERVSQ